MGIIFKGIKIIVNIFVLIILVLFIFIIFNPVHNSNSGSAFQNNMLKNLPFSSSSNNVAYNTKADSDFSLTANDIIYNTKIDSNITKVKANNAGMDSVLRDEILNRAKAMTEVKWIPKYNLIEKDCFYVFLKGKTYTGVPYSMDPYQVSSPNNFLSMINDSKTLYGNDCSGFVSAAWGISRQTTLTLLNEVKDGYKVDGKSVCQISWDDLEPGDALLIDNGNGEGHVMLYIDTDKENSDNLNVYEQNIATVIPYEPIPVARRDVRSKSLLMKYGYIPIRLIGNT